VPTPPGHTVPTPYQRFVLLRLFLVLLVLLLLRLLLLVLVLLLLRLLLLVLLLLVLLLLRLLSSRLAVRVTCVPYSLPRFSFFKGHVSRTAYLLFFF